jgi:hypothetical protein
MFLVYTIAILYLCIYLFPLVTNFFVLCDPSDGNTECWTKHLQSIRHENFDANLSDAVFYRVLSFN